MYQPLRSVTVPLITFLAGAAAPGCATTATSGGKAGFLSWCKSNPAELSCLAGGGVILAVDERCAAPNAPRECGSGAGFASLVLAHCEAQPETMGCVTPQLVADMLKKCDGPAPPKECGAMQLHRQWLVSYCSARPGAAECKQAHVTTLLDWSSLPDVQTKQAATKPAATALLTESKSNECATELLGASPFAPPAGDQRYFYRGFDTSAVDQSAQAGVNLVFESFIRLPPGAKLATLADVETLLEVEKLKDLVGCNDVSCMADIAGALGADYVIAGQLTQAFDELLLNVRVISAQDSLAAGKATMRFSGKTCLAPAARHVADALFAK